MNGNATICNEKPVDIKPERIIAHRDFDKPTKNKNDIALIRLEQPVNFTSEWLQHIGEVAGALDQYMWTLWAVIHQRNCENVQIQAGSLIWMECM